MKNSLKLVNLNEIEEKNINLKMEYPNKPDLQVVEEQITLLANET